MAMGMGGHGGGGQFGGMMRSMRRDDSVTQQHVTKGTTKRMFQFARPYRKILIFFLVLVTIEAVVGVINPLLFRSIINNGIEQHDKRLIIGLSLVAALVAIVDTSLTIGIRWVSAKVGEGLIYDMRSQVFDHIQRMPLAFFTRTQTGALISRLNNDVIGAQQAFSDTLSSVVSNLISVILVLIVMFFLSWQITLASLIILPVFVFPAKRVGRRLSVITRESYALNAQMNNTMNERFNVSGALLVKLFGRPGEERETFERKAGRVRDIGVTQAMYARFFIASLSLTAALATALVYGWGGVQAVDGALSVGTVVALASYLIRLYGPLTALSNVQLDVMTALVSFDRVFEVLDLPPMIAEKEDARPVPPGPARIDFDHVDFRYPTAEEVSLASLGVGGRAGPDGLVPGALRRDLHRRTGPDGGPGGAVGGRQDHHQPTPAPPLRRHLGDHRHQRVGRPGRHLRITDRHHRGGHPGRPPLPRDHPREPAVRQARRHRRASWTPPWPGPRSPPWSSRCPRAWTPWWAIGATGCPAERSSAWPSPASC